MADTRSQSEADDYKVLIKRLIKRARTSIPGIVTNVSSDGQTLRVTPVIRRTITIDGERQNVDMPEIVNVPLVVPHVQMAGFSLTLPVQIGDQVALLVCDRSIDNWVEHGGIQNIPEPVAPKTHNINDSLAIVGATPDPDKIQDYQLDRMEMRNRDRTIRFSLSDTHCEMVFGGFSIVINGSGINLTGGITHTGDYNQTGNFTATGTVNGDTDVTGGATGISLTSHTHPSPAGGNTGAPNP